MKDNLLLKFCVTTVFVFIVICGGFYVISALSPTTMTFDRDGVIIAAIIAVVLSLANLDN